VADGAIPDGRSVVVGEVFEQAARAVASVARRMNVFVRMRGN
jgi:hypothetical protein